MDYREESIPQSLITIQCSRRRSVCNQSEHKGTQVLQLVQGRQLCVPRLVISHLITLEQPLRLPDMVPDTAGYPKDQNEEVKDDLNCSLVEISYLTSRTAEFDYKAVNISTGNCSNIKSKKREIAAIREKELGSSGMETQWNSLQDKFFSEDAISILFPNQRSARRKTRNKEIERI
ncbi:hypothetical protein AYI70_g6541 [Smittium culicis]|uniref:Uncharacterized protein n=1 Tax=Smittium culicis TaxID=133412 RepID=A0A1R1XPL1_9FUNG|nr:hypothetical protein AYI70_g6541 [Smittium culicis]